jgi:ectoine hydroxylase-related dioxygenase (phytanoyl-CoA dioxygenase family)
VSGLVTHGVREFHRNQDELDAHAEAIATVGYSIAPGVIAQEELRTTRDKIDSIYQRQVGEIGGAERLAAINDLDMARCLIAYDDYFLRFATDPLVLGVLTRLLGEFFVLMSQNGVINRPSDGHYQLTWHRDLNYQHFVSSRPLAVSVLICVDEFARETGGTHLLPASHKSERFPSPEFAERHEVVVEAPAGSAILFDAMLFHRAGENTSGVTRRAINHIFTLPLINQQISLPDALGGRHSDDAFLRRLLGYETKAPGSTQAWREWKLGLAAAGALQSG